MHLKCLQKAGLSVLRIAYKIGLFGLFYEFVVSGQHLITCLDCVV